MYNFPHVDDAEGVLALLLYLNDCDGDTIIFNEKTFDPDKGLTPHKRITPKRNRCVLFDPRYLHASTPPVESDYRLILNIVFKKEEDEDTE